MEQMAEQPYCKYDFWSGENLKRVEPHCGLETSAHLVNRMPRDAPAISWTWAAARRQRLIEYGAAIDAKEPDQHQTALMWAAAEHQLSVAQAVSHLLDKNINYHCMDTPIHNPAPNLLQTDFLENPISFQGRRFNIVLAHGVFEYAGTHQAEKLAEIKGILKEDGTFVVSYVNFDHINIYHYPVYNNVQSF